MKNAPTILVADRNPHIRDLLKRELAAIGFRVHAVDNAHDLLHLIYSEAAIDLLVVDPSLPCMEPLELVQKIADRIPQLPLVLHIVRGEEELADFSGPQVVHLEKNGSSIETLKKTIGRLI